MKLFNFGKERPQGRSSSPIGDLAAWDAGNPQQLASTVHGSAEWAWVSDLVRWGLYAGSWEDAPGFPLGCHKYTSQRLGRETSGVIRWPFEGHRLIVGSPGTGKFTSAIGPMLLSKSEQSVIVLDPKGGEAMTKTARFRGQFSLVGVLTPEATAADFERDGAGDAYLALNPIDALTKGADAVMAAKRLSDALIVRVEVKHSFWDEVAHRWMTATLLYVAMSPAEQDRTLMRVQEIISSGWPDEVLFAMLNMGDGGGIVQRAAREIEQNQEAGGEGSRLYMDVRAALLNALQFLDAPGVRESMGQSNFDPAILRTHHHPCTLYIVVDAQNIEVYARWLRLIYTALVDLVARAPGREVAVIVDEFAALKRFDRIVQDLATLRGAGFRLHLAVQDLSQLHDLYGQGWQSIVGNCGIRQFLGVNDVFTAEYVERLLGNTTVEKPYAQNVKPWGSEGPGFWKSDLVGRPLLSAAEVTNLPRAEQIILLEGLPKPVRTFKAHYFAYEPWRSRATA